MDARVHQLDERYSHGKRWARDHHGARLGSRVEVGIVAQWIARVRRWVRRGV